jgi:hypothetical protein
VTPPQKAPAEPRVLKPAKVAVVPVKRTVASISSVERFPYGALVFLTMVAVAAVCFAAAALPATAVPWRPAAYVVATRHVDFAIVGLALLLLAALMFVATGGT